MTRRDIPTLKELLDGYDAFDAARLRENALWAALRRAERRGCRIGCRLPDRGWWGADDMASYAILSCRDRHVDATTDMQTMIAELATQRAPRGHRGCGAA
jgi:hypothetical protein